MNIRYIHRWCSTDKSNGIAFVGVWSPTNVWAICPGSRSRPCGKLMNFFYMLPILAAFLAGEPPKQAQLHNLLIAASSIYKEMYQTNSTLHNSIPFKYHYETKKSRSSASLPQVVILSSSTTCVEHHLGEHISCHSIVR
jgi:hypothetical protein